MVRPAFAVPCNDNFCIMLEAFLRSLIGVDPFFDYTIYVICDRTLSHDSRDRLSAIYPAREGTPGGIVYHEADPSVYSAHGKMTMKYYSFECFQLYKYGEKKIISIDADCLCISNTNKLVAEEVEYVGMPKERQRPEMFSSGVMVIGEKALNEETYRGLLETDYRSVNMYGNDMRSYNLYFKGRITEIDYMYDVVNTELEFFEEDGRQFEDIVFLHLINKPIARDFPERVSDDIYKMWMRYAHLKIPEEATK